MASSPSTFLLAVVFFFSIMSTLTCSSVGSINANCFNSIVSFGDSLTDTGNCLIALEGVTDVASRHFPYGETYFHHPTGRFSDGRLILDFIAEAMGMPYVTPAFGKGDFRRGVNFAVGGATAIKKSFYTERKIKSIVTKQSLGVQVNLFRKMLPSLCTDCDEFFNKSIFFVGEIGANDYFTFLSRENVGYIESEIVPRVIDTISSAVTHLVKLGAKTLVIPGFLPVGCVSSMMARFQSSNQSDYEPDTKCIRRVNELVKYHNEKLKHELDQSRKRHPSATIVYADYYGPTLRIFQDPYHFGFGQNYFSACCGGGGPYNVKKSIACGGNKATVCSDPSKYINWDGGHFTEAAYKVIANGLMHGPSAFLRFNHTCNCTN